MCVCVLCFASGWYVAVFRVREDDDTVGQATMPLLDIFQSPQPGQGRVVSCETVRQ